MAFFTKKMSWTNLEFIPFKLCVASFYVLLGAYFHEFFSTFRIAFYIVFSITVTWTMLLWIKKMRS